MKFANAIQLNRKSGGSPIQLHCYAGKKTVAVEGDPVPHGVKAFEKVVISPCTLVRTWGAPVYGGQETESAAEWRDLQLL